MAHESYNLHHQPRAHGYQPVVPSRPHRHSPDVEDQMGDYQTHLLSKSRKGTCKLPFDPVNLSKKKLFVARCALWIGLVATAGLIAYILVYYIMAGIKGGKSSGIPITQFNRYKNSQFAECVQRTPDRAVNCTLLEANLDSSLRPNFDWIGQENHHHFMSGPEYQISNDARDPKPSWCDLVSCFADWTVIPSTPRDSAFGLTGLRAWQSILVVGFLVLWTFKSMLDEPKACSGARIVVHWPQLLWKVSQTGFWWWGFVTLVSDPERAGPVALATWVVTWDLANSLCYHPWACYFDSNSRLRRGIVVGLHLLTFATWAATIHAVVLHNRRDSIQKYDCIASGIETAPGSSNCTAERLCSTTWMFQNPDFMTQGQETSLKFYEIPVYVQMATYPLFAGAELCRPWLSVEWKKGLPIMPLFSFLFAGYLGLVLAVPYFLSGDPKLPLDFSNGFATVAYDFSCRAVHIGISPKYAYLDIKGLSRDLRIARSWFNA